MSWKNISKIGYKMKKYKLKNFIIKKATINNLEDILRLNLDLNKKEYKEYDKSLDLNSVYSSGSKKYFKDRIQKSNGFVEVVFENTTNKVVGYLCGGLSKIQSYRKNEKYAELENMIIDKNCRSNGIGGVLVKNFVNWCKKKKVKYISVTALAQNLSGINFYRKNGFKDYELTLEKKLR